MKQYRCKSPSKHRWSKHANALSPWKFVDHNCYFAGYTRKGNITFFSPLGFKISLKMVEIPQICWCPLRDSYFCLIKRKNLSLLLNGDMILWSAPKFRTLHTNVSSLKSKSTCKSSDQFWFTWKCANKMESVMTFLLSFSHEDYLFFWVLTQNKKQKTKTLFPSPSF